MIRNDADMIKTFMSFFMDDMCVEGGGDEAGIDPFAETTSTGSEYRILSAQYLKVSKVLLFNDEDSKKSDRITDILTMEPDQDMVKVFVEQAGWIVDDGNPDRFDDSPKNWEVVAEALLASEGCKLTLDEVPKQYLSEIDQNEALRTSSPMPTLSSQQQEDADNKERRAGPAKTKATTMA
jgi:hypothetical protein